MNLSIIAEEISVRVGQKYILENISASFFGPGLYFLIGRNGSGKSTFLRVLPGLISYEGNVLINGKNQREYSRKELAEIIGYVWQNPLYGFFEESVEREILFILKNLGRDYSMLDNVVEMFRIRHLMKRSPFTLSGGEAKRVSICSVIVADQPIILFDEPESEMDLSGLESLVEFIRRSIRDKLIIIATHNPLVAIKLKKYIKKIYFIEQGKMIREGGTEIFDDEEFLEGIGVVSPSWWID
ncbi:MAG: ABC transporter ATP-binding protein [Candidatus Njordarchaeota archaeon]